MKEVPSTQIGLVLADGVPVENRLQRTCTVPIEQIAAILSRLRSGPRQLKAAVDIAYLLEAGNPGGMVNIVPRRTGVQPLWAKRWGKNWQSPFLDAREPEFSTVVTVLLERRDQEYYSIGAAHYGRGRPPEPPDLRGLRREAERLSDETGEALELARSQILEAAHRFWEGQFAFRLGGFPVVCTRCQKVKIEAAEVRAAVHGRSILCLNCENRVL